MAADVPSAQGTLYVPAGGGTAVQMDGDSTYIDNLVILGFRNGIVSVLLANGGGGSANQPRIGWVKVDTANAIRIDQCNAAGQITGPINQASLLTAGLPTNASSHFTMDTASDDMSGGTNFTLTIANDATSSLNQAQFSVGMPLKVTLAMIATKNAACYNVFNFSNVTPFGLPSNRYDASVTAYSLVSNIQSLTINLPGMSTETFFDVSAASLTAAPNTEIVGNVAPSGVSNLGSVLLNVTSVGLYAPAVGVGSLISGTGIIAGTVIGSASSIGIGTYALNVPQKSEEALIQSYLGGVVSAAISTPGATSFLNVNATLVGTVTSTGTQLLLGSEILPGSTIVLSLPGTYAITPAQTYNAGDFAGTFSVLNCTTAAGALTSNGTNGTLTSASGSLTVGSAVYGSGVLPGSYVSSVTGAGPYVHTLGVLQALASPAQPIAITAQSGTIFGGAIYSGGNTLSAFQAISGNISTSIGFPVIGPGILPNTYIESNISGTHYLLSQTQTYSTGSGGAVMIAPDATALLATVSGTLMTVLGSSSSTALSSGQILTGAGVQSGTSITGSISTTGALGVYSIGTPQLVGSSGHTLTFTAVPVEPFLGSILGTVLTVAPTGTLSIGQCISAPGLAYQTKISTAGTVSSGTLTYGLTNSVSSPIVGTISAAPIAGAVSGNIGEGGPSSTLSTGSSITLFGSLTVGQQINGPGVSSPTSISSTTTNPITAIISEQFLTGPEIFKTTSPVGAVFTGGTGGISSSTLTVASVSSGCIGAGQALAGANISGSVYIVPSGTTTGTGGPGTYLLSSAVSLQTGSTLGSYPASSSFYGTISGSTLTVPPTAAFPAGATIAGTGITDGTAISSQILGNYYAISNSLTIGSTTSPSNMTMTGIGKSSTSPPATIYGYISAGPGSALPGDVLSITGTLTGSSPITAGQQLFGYGVIPGTTISSGPTTSGGNTTCLLSVAQTLTLGPVSALQSGTAIAGSISGTVLSGTVLAGTPVAGQLVMGPGIPTGTSFTSVSVVSGSVTATLTVPQYSASAITAYGAGSVVVGQVSSTVSSSVLAVSGGAIAGSAAGQILLGTGLLTGTNIVSGTNSPYPVAVSQTAVSQPISLFTPLTSLSVTGMMPILTLDFAETRPGRLIELNNAPGTVVSQIQAFGASTTLRVIDSTGVKINSVGYDANPPDMNTTVIDLQGATLRPLVDVGHIIDTFTFLNNNTSTSDNQESSGLILSNCEAGTSTGGTLVNHVGGRMRATGCNFNAGNVSVQSPELLSFSASEFALGGGGALPTTFTYGPGTEPASFDPSCQNVPASALSENSLLSPGSELSGLLSVAIGGQLGSDLGRTGYLVFPSAADFTAAGDRQSGRTVLGATTSGATPGRFTADGNSVTLGGANSIGMGISNVTFCSGKLLAYDNSGANWAVWPNVSFGMQGGGSGLVSATGTGTTTETFGPSSSTWAFNLGFDTTNNCVSATGTGSSGIATIHWILALDCVDVGQ